MRNPLFESLVTKANTYKNPFLNEQEKPQPGTVFSDYVKSLAKMGNDLAANFIIAVNSYPEPSKFKDEYVANLPTKIQAAIDAIDTKETIGPQLEKFYNALRQEVNNFLSASKGDTEYVNLLEEWRKNLSSGFKNYKVAIDKAMAYVKQQEESGQAKMEDSDWELLKKLVSGGLAKLKDEMQTKATLAGESKTFFPEEFSSKDQVIEQLINNKIAIDFNSFSKILNEAKEDRVARRNARAESARVETLEGSVKGVLELIAMRSGDPSRKNFKSLAMNGEFVSLIKSVAEVRAELSVDDEQKKDIDFKQVSKTISNLESLFKSKKDAFDKAYDEESKTLRSFKTLSIATPEVEKYKQDGDNAFNTLSMLSQNAANQAAMERKKPKPKVDEPSKPDEPVASTGSSIKIANTVKYDDKKKGAVNDDVKKVQQLIIDKLGKKLKDDETYKKFAKFGADGKFGKNTSNQIIKTKAGLGLKDTSSDITQELVDALSAVKESFVFEQEFNMDAYNKAGSQSSGPRVPTKEDVSKNKKALSDAAKEISKETPKLPAEEVKKQIDDAINKAKEEWNKEAAIKELKTIGATPNPDYGKNGQMAIATANGMRFYSNGVALRRFDSMMGFYDVAKDEFKGNDGSKDKLTTLIKTAIPSKFAQAFSQFNYNPAEACKKYIGWSSGTIAILNTAFKETYKKSLDKHLANKLSTWYGSVNDEVDAFRKKFASVIS